MSFLASEKKGYIEQIASLKTEGRKTVITLPKEPTNELLGTLLITSFKDDIDEVELRTSPEDASLLQGLGENIGPGVHLLRRAQFNKLRA